MQDMEWFAAWAAIGEDDMYEVVKVGDKFRIRCVKSNLLSKEQFYTGKSARHHMKKGLFKISAEKYNG